MISDTQVDAIVAELKALAQAFKPQQEQEVPDEESVIAESVIDASERLDSARGKIDAIDDLLARLRG
jgi:hypothetical protein